VNHLASLRELKRSADKSGTYEKDRATSKTDRASANAKMADTNRT
jgi:hypothetical protein